MVPGGDQEQRRGVRADAVQGEQAGACPVTRGTMSASREAIWPPGQPGRLPSSRSAIRVWQPATAPGRGRSDARLVTRSAVACAVNRARRSSGPVTIRARASPVAWVRSELALCPSAISARTASTAPSRPFGAPRALPDCAAVPR